MPRIVFRMLNVMLWVAALGSVGFAELATIVAGRDNTIFSASTRSAGATFSLIAGRTNTGAVRRGLLWFDIANQIPRLAKIDSVTLTLQLEGSSQVNTQTVSGALHRVENAWGEGTSGAGTVGTGQGQTAAVGDATWTHRFFDTQNWTVPGGDFAATSSATTGVGTAAVPYVWSSTPALISDVQMWLDDPSTNDGWALIVDESQNATSRRFLSRESADVALRPHLTVNYQIVPEPSTFALIVCGGALLVRRRVRNN